jgi:lysyl-tRNA synthetase class 2
MARSSLVQRAIYDPAKQTLAVTFSTGRTYLYFDVPADVYAELQTAESMGQYFNWRVRDQYEFRELD